MAKLTRRTLAQKLLEKRGKRTVRDIAADTGISAATISRVERGSLPDLDTFAKLCRWLNVDPGELLGITTETKRMPKIAVHLRKDISRTAALALAEVILAAQRALVYPADARK